MLAGAIALIEDGSLFELAAAIAILTLSNGIGQVFCMPILSIDCGSGEHCETISKHP